MSCFDDGETTDGSFTLDPSSDEDGGGDSISSPATLAAAPEDDTAAKVAKQRKMKKKRKLVSLTTNPVVLQETTPATAATTPQKLAETTTASTPFTKRKRKTPTKASTTSSSSFTTKLRKNASSCSLSKSPHSSPAKTPSKAASNSTTTTSLSSSLSLTSEATSVVAADTPDPHGSAEPLAKSTEKSSSAVSTLTSSSSSSQPKDTSDETQWMPKASRSGRTIKRRSNGCLNGEASLRVEAPSPDVKDGTPKPCERKGCPLDVPICFANEAPSCASSRFTPRWYHLSSGEHLCNDCYELYYRGNRVGKSLNGTRFALWKRHWQANSRYVEGSMRQFASDQILPYWVNCTRPECRKWRQLSRSVELTSDYIARFTCGNIFNTGKSIHRSAKACTIPEDSRAVAIKQDFASSAVEERRWLQTLSAVPLLKNSPAALFLYEYYPDGVGLSPSCELCKSTDKENREKHSQYSAKNGSGGGGGGAKNSAKGFASAKVALASSPAKGTKKDASSPHPYLQTSPTKLSNGACEGKSPAGGAISVAPVGVVPWLQPFYQPFESQKARAIRPDVLEPWELEAFPQHEKTPYLYLGLRNTIVALWTLSPSQWLTLEDVYKHVVVRGLVRVFCLQVARQILYFLTVKALVNVGVLPKPGTGFLPSHKFRRLREKVVVIGAGPAGIATARQLHNFGVEVVVLEGRDRIGGRVWDDETTTGVTVGQGAHIVVGVVNNPVTLMCHQSGLTLREMNSSQCDLIDAKNGQLLDPSVDEGVNQLFNSALDDSAKWRKGKRAEEDESLLKRMQEWGRSLSKETEQEQRTFLFHVGNLEYACGSNLRHVSARCWDHNDAYDQFAGEHCLLVDGFQSLLTKLAAGLDIRSDARVKSVQYGKEGDEEANDDDDDGVGGLIRVTTVDDRVFRADKVVVTLPLKLLQDGAVEFRPPLPAQKIDAISRLGAGRLEKVALRFPRNFWAEKVNSADFFGHVPIDETDRGWFGVFYDLSAKNESGPFVLMSWVSGDAVDAMKLMPEEDIIAKCMRILRSLFSDVPDPTAHIVTRWSSDPMAGMCYSYVKVTGEGSHYDTLAETVEDRLYFAGEATQRRYPQTVTGALLSGFREAAKIVAPDWSELNSC